MTATLSTDYDAFLFSPISADAAGVPLTVLSTLARLNLDPWEEAARLVRLPRDSATERVASLLAVPETTAIHLVNLLHEPSSRPPRLTRPPAPEGAEASVKRISMSVYYLLAIAFMLIGLWAMAVGQPEIPANSGAESVPAAS